MKTKIIYLIFCLPILTYSQNQNKIKIEFGNTNLINPITSETVRKTNELLNIVFNSQEFEDALEKESFVCSNKPSICNTRNEIPGRFVFDDFVSKRIILVDLTVKKLKNPWKRRISKTMGETHPDGNLIVSYNWWLKNLNEKDLVIAYATHIGHEIFHTKYFKYIHDPEINEKKFINEKDVTYKIDDIIEALIKKNYH